MRQENISTIEIKSCTISSCGDKSSLLTISISLPLDFKKLSNQSKPNLTNLSLYDISIFCFLSE